MKLRFVAAAVCVGLLVTGGEALAQGMFGAGGGGLGASRRPSGAFDALGASLTPPREGEVGTLMEETAEDIGALGGEERFLRGNRDAGDFVGTDSGDRAGFVGSAGADNAGPIQSAVTGALVRTTTGPAINRARVRSPAPYMYEARLRVGFDFTSQPVPVKTTMAAQRLMRARAIDPASLIEVKLEGSTAILSGTVGSDREKKLAGMMLMFEPGISKVRNDLEVGRLSTPPARSPSDSAPAKPRES